MKPGTLLKALAALADQGERRRIAKNPAQKETPAAVEPERPAR
ncbi:MAG: hypothetical protein O3B08_07410 [Proteobacteria bacterium]|nr:hypothetical protein [Pseudomonadota bacterium]